MLRTTLVFLGIAAAVSFADKKKSTHPHFDDFGTLVWKTKAADAQALAKKENKLVLIEYGRKL